VCYENPLLKFFLGIYLFIYLFIIFFCVCSDIFSLFRSHFSPIIQSNNATCVVALFSAGYELHFLLVYFYLFIFEHSYESVSPLLMTYHVL
jgi:hypothetical protein